MGFDPTETSTDRLYGGAGADELYGNAGDDLLYGGSAEYDPNDVSRDELFGGLGADRLYGNAGNDLLYGGGLGDGGTADASDDELYGGLGADTLFGDAGDDLLYGGGLGNGDADDTFADLLFGGTGNDTLYGNAGDDSLDGGIGVDVAVGGTGDDTYYVDNAADQLTETANAGEDRVLASVSYVLAAGRSIELLAAASAAGTGTIHLTGNDLVQSIYGNAGRNILNGLAGVDTLTGYGGNDDFRFSVAPSTGVDRIVDFSSADDTIVMYESVYTALNAGSLDPSAYKDIGNPGAVVDADDRILYNDDTGALFYDSNGSASGGRVQFATLLNTPATLTAADFFVA